MLLEFLPILCAVFTVVNCNCGPCGPMPKHYEELGCVGRNSRDSPCCPNRYECPDLKPNDAEFCYYNGKSYRKGETISKADSPPCSDNCVCAESGDGDLKFNCPIQECPEMFSSAKSDCVHKYSLDQCCSDKKICGPERLDLPQCSFWGKTYNYGEKFVPQNIYAACYQCVCDEHFDNSSMSVEENKNCKKMECGVQLRHSDELKNGCIPMYFKDTKCCPIGFRCPSASDKIEPKENLPDISTVEPNSLCKFGSLTLQRWQSLVTDDKCLKCKCSLPPMMECIRTEDC